MKEELVKRDTFAFSLSIVGYYLGLVFIIGGALIGESKGLVFDLIELFSFGLFGIILLNLSAIINDKVILRKFSVKKELIEDQNAGTGVVEMASAIASGLVIQGAIIGDANHPREEMISDFALIFDGLVMASIF